MKTKHFLFLLCWFSLKIFAQNVWLPLNSGSTQDLKAISFPLDQEGYVAGDNGTLLKTSNAGSTWTNLNPGTSNDLLSVHFPGQSTGYVISEHNVFRTTNAGSTWQPVYSDTLNLFNVIYFVNDSTGFIGTSGSILKTSDYGASWTNVQNTSNKITSICFPSLSSGYFAGGPGIQDAVYKTTDLGQSFSSYTIGVQSIKEKIYFIDDLVGYIIGWYAGTLSKTTNGGQTWTQVITSHDIQGWDVYFSDQAHGFYIDNSSGWSKIFSSHDSGITWTADANGSTYTYRKFLFTSSGKGYAVGKAGGIYSTQLATALQPSKNETPVKLCIRPNPNNGYFKIESYSDLHLTLINSTGQKIKTIHLDHFNSHAAELNGLAEGIYYLNGENESGDFIHEKIIVRR